MTDALHSEWEKLVKESRAAPGSSPPPPGPPLITPPRRKARWSIPLLFLISVGAMVLYVQGALNPWPVKATPEEIAAGRKAAMMMALKAIHDYAAFHGHYPQSIDQVLPLSIDIHYERTATGFRLRMPGPDGQQIVIDGK